MKLIKKLVLLATIGVFVFGMTTTTFAENTVNLTLDPGADGTIKGKAKGESVVIPVEKNTPIDSDTLPKATRDGYKFEGWDYDFRYGISQDTSVPAEWSRVYNVISGDNQTFYTESSNDLVIRIDGDINYYEYVFLSKQVEEKVWEGIGYLDEDDCSATEGSTVLTLKNSFLKTLQSGYYKLQASFEDGVTTGDAYAFFTIVEGPDPNAPTQDPTLPDDTTVPVDSDASESTTPKTGDNSNMAVCVGIAMAAAAGVVTVVVFKKKTNA